MKRRETLGLLLGSAATLTFAQAPGVARLGILRLSTAEEVGAGDLFQRSLQTLGWVEGKSLHVERRFANYQAERLPELAAELVRARVDVILAFTNLPAFAAKGATRTIPIVVWGAHDAVGTGLARTLARPGGNVTGVESLAPELDAKRLELLKQIVPGLKNLAVLYNPDDPGSPIHLRSVGRVGQMLGFGISKLEVRRAADYESMFAVAAGTLPDGLLMLTDVVTFWNWRRVAEFAQKHRVPTVCEFSGLADAGCLVSYGPSFAEITERAAAQVDRILHGARAADLPFEQPTRFELIVNLKTARAIGFAVPQMVLLRADRVVE